MQNFIKKLGFKISEKELLPYYEKARAALTLRGCDILDIEKHNAFTYTESDVLKLRDEVRGDGDALLYCYLLSAVLENEDTDVIKAISRPCADKNSAFFDTLPLFGLLDRVHAMLKYHKEIGIPEEVSRATVGMFENQMQDFYDIHGHTGISTYVGWMNMFLSGILFRIGRFNFELFKSYFDYDVYKNSAGDIKILPRDIRFHKSGQVLGSLGCENEDGSFVGRISEDEEFIYGIKIENAVAINERVALKKSEWTRILKKDDSVISVHIPSGGPLSTDVCENDLAYGKRLLDDVFGRKHILFCCSWLLNPQIKAAIGKENNITKFGDRFVRFPIKSNAEEPFTYIWRLPSPCAPELLSEESSLARGIKSHLCKGGHIHDVAGVISE